MFDIERRLVRVAVTNRRSSAMTIVIEPWAREVSIGPGESTLAEFERGEPRLLIELEDDRLVLYGWEGSMISDATPSPPSLDPPRTG